MNGKIEPDSMCNYDVCSNFDGLIDYTVVEELKKGGVSAGFPAWDYYGCVWFDGNEWICSVRKYHAVVDVIKANCIEELVENVKEKHGYD